MPLSEHEQRLLDEIEQALYAEDPKFAASVRSTRARSRTRRTAVLCALGAVIGLGLVLIGLVANVIVVSVIGFVAVVSCCGYGVQVLRGRDRASATSPLIGRQPAGRHSGLRSRMEDRLRRRFDES